MKQRKRQADVVFEPIMCSLAMKRLAQIVRAVATKEVTLMLLGESGVGKEVLARRAHELSVDLPADKMRWQREVRYLRSPHRKPQKPSRTRKQEGLQKKSHTGRNVCPAITLSHLVGIN